ncbi:hypothetical protein BT69DRAFT_1283411 [Atractiella rhizophila]|nr:hypothetical protein BT69DRAFT_1283411 [Atractiella rhizophila]
MYDARNIEKPTSVDGLLKTLPELMNNISLSLLSLTPSTTSTSCISHPYALTYVYTPLVLISAYALGLLLSLLAVLLGTKLFTLHFPAQNTFKDFVLASRNSGLDVLVDGREGTWKVREEAAKEKLRLGAMKDGRLAFGTKEELVDSRG